MPPQPLRFRRPWSTLTIKKSHQDGRLFLNTNSRMYSSVDCFLALLSCCYFLKDLSKGTARMKRASVQLGYWLVPPTSMPWPRPYDPFVVCKLFVIAVTYPPLQLSLQTGLPPPDESPVVTVRYSAL